MESPQAPQLQEQQEEEEVKWTDACIRWTEDEVEPHMRPSHDHDTNNDDQEEFLGDPFADPEPLKEYSLEYTVRVNDNDNTDNDTINNTTSTHKISLNIQGYLEDTDEAWESTGLTLWKATHTLNDYLVQNYHRHMTTTNHHRSLQILELGAGLGVCGILLSKLMRLTASSSSSPRMKQRICITDGDTQALKLLRQNVQRNHNHEHHHDDEEEEEDDNVVVSVQQLLWGRATAQAFLKVQPHHQEPQQRFDYIVASDIIYAPQVLVPLWETIDVLLADDASSNPNAKFILAFCQRQVPVQVQDVLDMATQFHFQATRIEQVNHDHHHPNSETITVDDMTASKEHAVYLYEFQRQTPPPSLLRAQQETTTNALSS